MAFNCYECILTHTQDTCKIHSANLSNATFNKNPHLTSTSVLSINQTWFNQFHIISNKQSSSSISINWMTVVNACAWVCVCVSASVSNGITNVNNRAQVFPTISCVQFIVFWYHKSNWCEREQNKRLRLWFIVCFCYIFVLSTVESIETNKSPNR